MLGVFVGNPNGNDPNENSRTIAALKAHNQVMGYDATCMNAFTSFSVPWIDPVNHNDVIANINWCAWSWSRSPEFQHLVPIIGIPMALNSDWPNQPAVEVFRNISAGVYDEVWKTVPTAWSNNGFNLIYVRFGYEMDASYMPWSMGGTAESVADWVAAFRHMSMVMKGAGGATVKVVWNPAATNYYNVDVATSYPGDDVVDVIGLDLYSIPWPASLYDWASDNGTVDDSLAVWQANPLNREHFWDIPGANQWQKTNPKANNGWGMIAHQQFAVQQKKPIAICESGVGVSPSYPNQGIADDGHFPRYLAKRLFAPGAPTVEFVNVWDTNVGDGLWQFYDDASNKPNARASWAYFAKELMSAAVESQS